MPRPEPREIDLLYRSQASRPFVLHMRDRQFAHRSTRWSTVSRSEIVWLHRLPALVRRPRAFPSKMDTPPHSHCSAWARCGRQGILPAAAEKSTPARLRRGLEWAENPPRFASVKRADPAIGLHPAHSCRGPTGRRVVAQPFRHSKGTRRISEATETGSGARGAGRKPPLSIHSLKLFRYKNKVSSGDR